MEIILFFCRRNLHNREKMEKIFETDLSVKEVQGIIRKAHRLADLTYEESLEFHKYLTRKVEKMDNAFKKNINGALTDEELNEVLDY
jgi:hypothetical protein